MALIDKKYAPSTRELRIFGMLMAVFLGMLGEILLRRTGSWTVAYLVWAAALLLSALYYLAPVSQSVIFRAWMSVVYPIGWVVSHLLVAITFYFVITPIGLAIRWLSRDSLNRSFDRSAKTYWVTRNPVQDPERYFQQF